MSQATSLEDTIRKVGGTLREEIEFAAAETPSVDKVLKSLGLAETSNPKQTVCDLAAFNRYLKIVLYDLYAEEYSELRHLDRNVDFNTALADAHNIVCDVALKQNPLDQLFANTDNELSAELFEIRTNLQKVDSPTEKIGVLFERLVNQEARRKRGQFHTPKFIADFMAKWAIRDSQDRVLDPGIGAGVLTSGAYEEKQRLAGAASVNELWGIDVTYLAILMASTGLKIENGEGSPNLFVGDYIDTKAEATTARLDQQEPISLPTVDAVVSNPPYSRSDELAEDRSRFNSIVKSETELNVAEYAPLYTYFFGHSTQFVDEEGRLAFITPSRFHDTNYGAKLRSYLLEHFNLYAMIFIDTDIEVFPNARIEPCITFLEKTKSPGESETRFLRVEEWPDAETVFQTLIDEPEGEVAVGYKNILSQKEVLPERDWRDYVNPNSVDSIPSLTIFSQIADIKRGIATGKNDYFCLTAAEVAKHGLREEHIVKFIRRTAGLNKLSLTQSDWNEWKDSGNEVWLLYCYDERDDEVQPITETDGALEDYLQDGIDEGAHATHLAQNRSPWYAVDKRNPPDVLATYMSRDGFRFIENEADLRTLNNLHNIYLDDYDQTEIRALLAYLNSSIAGEVTKHSGRTYADGLHKIEPSELKSIPVFDPKNLGISEIERLATAFEALCTAIENEDAEEDLARSEMDNIVCDVLDLPFER